MRNQANTLNGDGSWAAAELRTNCSGFDVSANNGDTRAAVRGIAFSTRTDSFSLRSTARPSSLIATGRGFHLHPNRAAEDVRLGNARAIDFHAELGAQVGDGGGGSADSE